MENRDKNEITQKAKAPIADEKNKLEPSISSKTKIKEEKDPGKLPDPDKDFGVDHNSDPIISKTP